MDNLTHFNEAGRAKMVDVSEKDDTVREAIAAGYIYMKAETVARIKEGRIKKGDVLAVAQIAGVMAVKQTGNLIPMCHPLLISGVDLDFEIDSTKNRVEIKAKVRTTGKTGVEMEALTAVSTAALTIYDMCKAVDKDMTITQVRLLQKTGGKSGTYIREESK
ncbi:cyclic pyranopterin phosphate synthase [Desulfitispora alkaliphila]|uniref:cyclic pyranopterin monophosphate synthase MoaC n=1 Tax=Desulfitispora alkaliphila TaxID=622674 RepID=UPI003D218BD3